jgi:hypothetical protein
VTDNRRPEDPRRDVAAVLSADSGLLLAAAAVDKAFAQRHADKKHTHPKPLVDRLAKHAVVSVLAEDARSSADNIAEDILRALADVGGVVHDSNMDSNDEAEL